MKSSINFEFKPLTGHAHSNVPWSPTPLDDGKKISLLPPTIMPHKTIFQNIVGFLVLYPDWLRMAHYFTNECKVGWGK